MFDVGSLLLNIPLGEEMTKLFRYDLTNVQVTEESLWTCWKYVLHSVQEQNSDPPIFG